VWWSGSNGSPEHPNSLHFLDRSGQRLNQYQQAILGIGSILKDYSTGTPHSGQASNSRTGAL
jgi:hypothetical protein